MAGDMKVVIGSGNVFADLGFANADDMRLRAEAVEQIRMIVAERKLKQAEVAKLLGLKQPDVSALLHGRLTKFALERLLRFLTVLGRDVAIVVKNPSGKRPARMTFEGLSPAQREM